GVWQTGPLGRQVSLSNPAWRAEFDKVLPDWRDADVVGSPFAIRAYRVHQDFGGDDALAHLRERLQRRGVRLLLHFVPTHTGRDPDWVSATPEYRVAGGDAEVQREPHNYASAQTAAGPRILAYGRDPYFPGWPDTFQLNYRAHACREAMAKQLVSVA